MRLARMTLYGLVALALLGWGCRNTTEEPGKTAKAPETSQAPVTAPAQGAQAQAAPTPAAASSWPASASRPT